MENDKCPKCGGTGVIETGNNDYPCQCASGDTALFNVSGMNSPVSGKRYKQELKDRLGYGPTEENV